MGYYKTTGVVLRRMNLGEADRILTIFTRDNGKVRAVAKGVRRIKSRMAGHLEPFGGVEFMFADGRNLDIITSARLVRSSDAIIQQAESLAYAYMFAEMLDRLVDEGVSQPELFEVAEESLADLAVGGPNETLELYFKLKLLDNLGYHPQLNGCTLCGNADPANQYFFAPEIGGIVDSACSRDKRFPLTLSQIKLWRFILAKPLREVRRLNDVQTIARLSLEACNSFYDYIFGRQFAANPLFD